MSRERMLEAGRPRQQQQGGLSWLSNEERRKKRNENQATYSVNKVRYLAGVPVYVKPVNEQPRARTSNKGPVLDYLSNKLQ